MRKILSSAVLAMSMLTVANAQTTAPNWTANDCNSVSHTLYTELDAGKIIVFVWVMPCGSCEAPAKTAFTAVESFAASHPGKVVYYMADDYGDASCNTLNSWVTSNNIGDVSKITFFGNAGNTINMNNFGGSGMPKIVVMGGSDHKIYFNKNNAAANDATGITDAINSALTAASVSSLENKIGFSVAPNPGSDMITINCVTAVKKVMVTTMNGQVAREIDFGNGKMNPGLDITSLPAGVYLVEVTDVDDKTGIQKIVKQ